MRRSWRDGRFSASGTLFHVDWKDIQVAGLTPFSAQPITLNGAGAVSRGVEFAGAAGVTKALRLRGSWSYTDAALSQDSPGLLDGGADAFKGDRCRAPPRHQGSLLASHAMLLGDETVLQLLYGYTYVGDVLTRIGLRARRRDPAGLPPPQPVSVALEERLDPHVVCRQPVRRVRRDRRAPDPRSSSAAPKRVSGHDATSANVLAPRRVGVRIRYTFQ